MWIERPGVASGCFRCPVRIPSYHPKCLPSRVHQSFVNGRRQSSASERSKDAGYSNGPRSYFPRTEKGKQQIRRQWTPPPTAKLGVSSLGKPAEVLVLDHRDRRVQDATSDETERPGFPQPQILDTLAGEDLKISQEKINISLDRLSDHYRNRPSLTKEEWHELKGKMMDGYTQTQLRSYCLERDPKDPINDMVLDKALLVQYISSRQWGLAIVSKLKTQHEIQVPQMELDFILTCKKSLLEQYAERYLVGVDASQADSRITIDGQVQSVISAHIAIKQLCRHIKVGRFRTHGNANGFRSYLASSDLIGHLSRKYRVMISWASSYTGDVSKHMDWLCVCYDTTQDLQNSLEAERELLFAEREFLDAEKFEHHTDQSTMWLPRGSLPKYLALQKVPENTERLASLSRGSRWVLPQRPIRMGVLDSEIKSLGERSNEFLASTNRQREEIFNVLSGKLNTFFSFMAVKTQRQLKREIRFGRAEEEVAVHFCKFLASSNDATALSDFSSVKGQLPGRKGAVVAGGQAKYTTGSADWPGLPTFLKTVSTSGNPDGTDAYDRFYRLRYVPVPLTLPDALLANPIDIDVVMERQQGHEIRHRVKNVSATIDEQSRKLLLPAFALDLEFVRRLKYPLLNIFKDAPWLKKIEENVIGSDWPRMPQFIEICLPQVAGKVKEFESDAISEGSEQRAADVEQENRVSDRRRIRVHRNWKASNPITYMLESCDLIHSTAYDSNPFCLEHLSFEGPTGLQNRDALRLSAVRLIDAHFVQPQLRKLLYRAFRIAALLGNPDPLADSGELTSLTAKKSKTMGLNSIVQ